MFIKSKGTLSLPVDQFGVYPRFFSTSKSPVTGCSKAAATRRGCGALVTAVRVGAGGLPAGAASPPRWALRRFQVFALHSRRSPR